MMHKRRKRVVLIVLALAGLTIVPTLVAVGRAAAEPPGVDASIGNWRFQYSRLEPEADGSYIIDVRYAKGTTGEVRAAAAAMNAAASQLVGSDPIEAKIVFTRPLPIQEFIQFATSNGLAPTGSVVRAVQPDGTRVTMGVPPVWAVEQGRERIGEPAPGQPPFDEASFARLQRRHAENRIVGVISTTVRLDQGIYQKLRTMPQVFAFDVLQEVVRREVQRTRPGVAAKQILVQGSQLDWAMEDTGIAVSN